MNNDIQVLWIWTSAHRPIVHAVEFELSPWNLLRLPFLHEMNGNTDRNPRQGSCQCISLAELRYGKGQNLTSSQCATFGMTQVPPNALGNLNYARFHWIEKNSLFLNEYPYVNVNCWRYTWMLRHSRWTWSSFGSSWIYQTCSDYLTFSIVAKRISYYPYK